MFRKLFLPLALFLFSLTACELQEPVQSISQPVVMGDPGCPEEYRTFPLDVFHQESGGYIIKIQTGPFIVDHCMCSLVNFKFYVTKNSNLQWLLTLDPNVNIPYTPGQTETEDLLIIEDLAPIFENLGMPGNGNLFANQRPNPALRAALNRASGLCIIDNFDGTFINPDYTTFPIGSNQNQAIVQLKPGPAPDSYIVKVYVPIGITSPL